jgi:hypothetical protein
MRAVFVILVLALRVARADVGVVVAGDPSVQAGVMNEVQRWVQAKKHELVASPLGSATATFVDCFVMEDIGCARKAIAEHARAANVIYVRVDMQAADTRTFSVIAYWFAKGQEPVSDKRTCEKCNEDKLGTIVEAMMTELAAKGTRGRGRLAVNGQAREMIVKIDGDELGPPPVDRELAAGSHELVFVHRGMPIDVRRVVVEAGAVVDVAVPRVSEADTPKSSSRSRGWPITFVIGGLVMGAAGGVLLYYGSKPEDGYEHGTKMGLPLALVGAFALGAGTSLLVGASDSGANVGVSRSF